MPAGSPAHRQPDRLRTFPEGSSRTITGAVRLLREHEELNAERLGLDERDWADLESFARKNQQDKSGNYRPVLTFGGRKRTLKATNFVGVLSTKRGKPIEILPKIDLAPPGEAMEAGDDGSMPGTAGAFGRARPDDHESPVMAWVRLFLFGHGLATYHGEHENQSLLFPMEEIYEDFVTRCFSRYQDEYRVRAQGPRKRLTRCPGAFEMKPDITLLRRGSAKFILDAKWKRLKSASDDPRKRGIVQADMYQLYAYSKRYGCRAVALVYPRTDDFDEPLPFVFHDDLKLLCLPFDPSQAKLSVHRGLAALKSPERAAAAWHEVVVDEAP